jgi:hypothetical protein
VVETCRVESAFHEQRRSLSDHAADRFLGQRLSPELDDQLVGGFSEVAVRIDQRAIEVEGDQAL